VIKNVSRFVLIALVASFIAAAGPTLASSGGDKQRTVRAGVVSKRLTQDRQAVRDYWTKQRMRDAVPLEATREGKPEPVTLDTGATTDAEPRVVPPSQAASTPVLTKSKPVRKQFGDPIPFTRTEVTNTQDAPYRTHGKVFFSSGGGDYVCSGTVVTSTSESLIATAGHCVHELSSGFSTNFEFVPGYRNGNAPFGEWAATELFTPGGWANSENFDFDAAMATLETHSGTTIQDTVGSRGITFNQDALQLFDAFGYPAGPPFDGSKLYRCDSGIGYRDGFNATAPIAIGCDMTGGSSGGGWVIQDALVNSVVSYGYDELPNLLFGPYFGTVIEDLYDEAGGGPAGSPAPTPTDTGTGSPTPTPTLPPDDEPVDHVMGLTLSLKRHLKALGRMTAPVDGYLACTRGAPIEIYRLKDPVTGVFVKGTSTGSDGRYSLRIKDRKGKYFAYGPAGPVDDLNFCLEAFSTLVKHKH
jgi:V8-like Glu-specific endopeptidase